jgi:hypothetical protein
LHSWVGWGVVIGRIVASVWVVLLVIAPRLAEAQQAGGNALFPFAQVVTSAEGFGQTGRFDNGSLTTAHQFSTRAYNVSLGVRLGEHLMIALRGQESRTDVSLSLAPQNITVHSRSIGVRTLVNVGPVVWDTTASRATNDNSTELPDLFGGPPLGAAWHGREWAVDTALALRLPVSVFVVEPIAGARVNTLHDDGYITGGLLPLGVPGQFRSTTTYRGELKVSAPIRLDQFGTLTPWASGEVSRTTNPNPPLGVLTELTGMAGGHYVFNLPELESTVPFPSQTWRTARAGLRLDVSPSFAMGGGAVWSWNDQGNWMAYRFDATVKF